MNFSALYAAITTVTLGEVEKSVIRPAQRDRPTSLAAQFRGICGGRGRPPGSESLIGWRDRESD